MPTCHTALLNSPNSPQWRVAIDYIHNGTPDSIEVEDTRIELQAANAWSHTGASIPVALLDLGHLEALCAADLQRAIDAADDARIEALAEAREHARTLEGFNP